MRHDGHARAQLIERRIGCAHAIDAYLAILRIEEAEQQIEDRAFAGARRADDGYGVAGLHAERYAVERRQIGAAGVGEANVVERDLSARRNGKRDGESRRADFRHHGQQLGEPLGGAGGLADFAPDFGDLRKGGAGEHGVEHELAEPADRHAAVDDGRCGEPQNAGDAADDEEHGEGGEHGARPHARLGGIEGEFNIAPVAIGSRLLVGECLHGARSGKVLGRICRSLGQRVLRPARQAAHRAAERDERQNGQRDGEQHQQRQVHARHEHHDEGAKQHDEAAQRLRQRRSGNRLDLRRVGREPAHQLAGVGALEESRAEVGDVTEHVAAQVGDDPLAQPVDVVEARRAGDGQHQADDDQHGEVAVDEGAVVRAEAEVDHPAHGHRDDQRRHRRDDERHSRPERAAACDGRGRATAPAAAAARVAAPRPGRSPYVRGWPRLLGWCGGGSKRCSSVGLRRPGDHPKDHARQGLATQVPLGRASLLA